MIDTYKKKYTLPAIVFVFVFILLAIVQIKMSRPIILLERFIPGGGWFELVIIALYGGFVA